MERIVPVRVWDAPTRLFHWALVILLCVSWLSERLLWMKLHFLSGYSIIALLLFRVAWGFIGSQTARFSQFIRGPLAALRHLVHLFRGEPDNEIGHNPVGGWMVLVMPPFTGISDNDFFIVQRRPSSVSSPPERLPPPSLVSPIRAAILFVIAVVVVVGAVNVW